MSKARRLGFPVMLVAVGFCLPAHAQQAIDRGPQSNQASQKPAKSATVKPAARPATTGTPDIRVPQTRQWTIDDALPSRRTYEPATASSSGLGRVPAEGGSFGFSTETKIDPYRTPDGNRIRGLDSSKSDPSYLGLSLSVPTDDKSILPGAILPNW